MRATVVFFFCLGIGKSWVSSVGRMFVFVYHYHAVAVMPFFFVVFLSLFIESIYLERPFGQCYNQAIKFPFLYFALVTVNYDDPQ